jgi:hypothetical protein
LVKMSKTVFVFYKIVIFCVYIYMYIHNTPGSLLHTWYMYIWLYMFVYVCIRI